MRKAAAIPRVLLLGSTTAVLLLLLLFISSASAAPTLTTDKPEYFFFDTVSITGGGFSANTFYDIPVIRPDGSIIKGDGSLTPGWDKQKTDASGNFTYLYQLDAMAGLYEVRAYPSPWSGDTTETPLASVTFTDAPPQISLEQCRNGPDTTPNDCLDLGGGTGWVTGNVGDSQGHLVEGYSVPYRAIMGNLPTSMSITVELGYDIKHSSAHAIDFLTHYQRLEPHSPFGHSAEIVTPTSGVSGIAATTTTIAIPAPSSTSPCASPVSGQPTTSFNSLPAGERLMTLFGGTITGIAYTTQGCLTDAVTETRISVTFTSDSSSTTAVLSWGGHIGRALDWGTGNSAGGISGSPYHMRLIDWTLGNVGNQDRSLSAGAVEPAGTVIINKVAVGGDDTFSYTATPNGIPAAFNITTSGGTGSQTFANVPASTKTVTESGPPAGWSFTSLSCNDPDSGSTVAGQTATIDLDPGETVECTFTNTINSDPFTVTKSFSDLNPAEVTVNLTCSSGTVSDGGSKLTSGQTATFTVTGGDPSTTCTAIESGVPAGYSTDNSACLNVNLQSPGSCTITNTLNSDPFTVTKSFSDLNPAEVTVNLACSSGFVSDGGSKLTSGQTATFTVTGGDASTTCTATESDVPAGYSTNNSACLNVNLQSPGSCTITNTLLPPTLTVDKVCVPPSDLGLFNLRIDTTTEAADAPCGGSTGAITVSVGAHTVDETAGTGSNLANYNSSISGACDAAGNVTLAAGENKTCTITNTRKTGKLEVVKDLIPSTDPGLFNLQIDGSTAGTGGDVGDGGSTSEQTVNTGTHSVDETAGTGTNLANYNSSIECKDLNGAGAVVASASGSGPLNVTVNENDDIVCTITNGKNIADVKITSQTVFAADCTSPAPDPIPVSQNTTICLRKVIHNNGPASPVDVSISKTATAPPDCTITPSGPITGSETNLVVSVDRFHDELFTIHCTEPSFHTFSFTNDISITTPGITDPTLGNNSASTNFTTAFTAVADLKVVSQTVGTPDGLGQCTNPPPAQIFVSQNTNICVRKVIHNNGPFAGADAVDTNTVSVVPPDCTSTPPQDVELIFNLPQSLDVTFDEFFTIHCTDRSFHTFTFTNILDPVEHVTDPDLSNNQLNTDIVIPVIDFTDIAIVSHQILSGPSQIDVSEDATVTIRKVIRNNGPISPVDVEVTRTFDPPPDCTAVPVGPITAQVILNFGQDETLDEQWTIHCTQQSFHTFNFINEINLKDPHLQDSIPGNNTGDSPFVFTAVDNADVKIVSQTVLTADCASPALTTIPVSQDTTICVRKVIHNNGPFGPVDVTIDKTASAPIDCTVTPSGPIAGSETNLQVSVDRVHDELFAIHCTQPSFHQFTFTNDITLVPITHIADPNTANNSATTNYNPGFTTPTDVEIVSQTVFAGDCTSPAPTSIPVSQNTDICVRKVIRNNGPFGPVDVTIDKTASAPADCTVTPSGAIQGSETNLQVSVDRTHDELFTIHCTQPSFHQFSFTNDVSIATLHVIDSTPGNNSTTTNVTPAFTAQADVEIVSQTVFAADCTSPAPTTTELFQNTGICLSKVVRNNGTFGPVDISVDKTAAFVPSGSQQAGDATVSPANASATIPNVAVSQTATHDEIFTVQCLKVGNFEFLLSNLIGVDLHVSDPITANNSAQTSFIIICQDTLVGGTVEFLSAAPAASESKLTGSGGWAGVLPLALGIAAATASVTSGVVYAARRWLIE